MQPYNKLRQYERNKTVNRNYSEMQVELVHSTSEHMNRVDVAYS